MSVGVTGGATEIYGFRISDGQIYPLNYKIALDKNNNKSIELAVGEAILDMRPGTDSEIRSSVRLIRVVSAVTRLIPVDLCIEM